MKKYFKLVVIFIITIAVIFLVFYCCQKTDIQYFTPENPEYINYNNYVHDTRGYDFGYMDYRDGQFAYNNPKFLGLTGSVFTIDVAGESQKLKGVNAPFQFCNEGIIYLNKDSLIYRDVYDDETEISSNVCSFMAWETKVLFMHNFEWSDEIGNWIHDELYIYDIQTGEIKTLINGVDYYLIYDNNVYVVVENSDGNCSLCSISLETYDSQFICGLHISAFPYSFQISNDVLVWYGVEGAYFDIMDLNTLEWRTLPVPGGPHKLNFMCEGDIIYYSYLGLIRDGSFNWTDKNNEHNGTWELNIISGERERITTKYYDKLYCFDKVHLYGYDCESGVEKIK